METWVHECKEIIFTKSPVWQSENVLHRSKVLKPASCMKPSGFSLGETPMCMLTFALFCCVVFAFFLLVLLFKKGRLCIESQFESSPLCSLPALPSAR